MATPELLKAIQSGKRLKKAETNDRSGPLVDAPKGAGGGGRVGGGIASSAPSAPAIGGGGGPPQLGGLLAGGIPKLKPVGSGPGAYLPYLSVAMARSQLEQRNRRRISENHLRYQSETVRRLRLQHRLRLLADQRRVLHPRLQADLPRRLPDRLLHRLHTMLHRLHTMLHPLHTMLHPPHLVRPLILRRSRQHSRFAPHQSHRRALRLHLLQHLQRPRVDLRRP